jgi:hypothetical protein
MMILFTCANAINPINTSGQIRYPEKTRSRDGYKKKE